MQAARVAFEHIKKGQGQEGLLAAMLTRADLYDLLGYDGYEARDRAYFGG